MYLIVETLCEVKCKKKMFHSPKKLWGKRYPLLKWTKQVVSVVHEEGVVLAHFPLVYDCQGPKIVNKKTCVNILYFDILLRILMGLIIVNQSYYKIDLN
jgi:uncharacterized membrane protein affecting hemolysin expression